MKTTSIAAIVTLAAFAVGISHGGDTAFSVSGIFSDHMVLQRGRPVPVWGEAAPGTKVSVRFGDVSAEAVAGPDELFRCRPVATGTKCSE